MTSSKNTKRALLASVLSVALCAAMLVGSTFAWFTDSVTSAGNIIKSGTLDVTMEWANGTSDPTQNDIGQWQDASKGAIFDYDLWEPGYTEVRHVKISNIGTLALKYEVRIAATGEVSELADVIDVYYIKDGRQIEDRTQLTEDDKIGTLTEVLAKPYAAKGNLLGQEGEKVHYDIATIALKMQESAGNEYQGLSIGSEFAIQLVATQDTVESDAFNNQYDKDAGKDTMICTLSEFNALTEIPDGIRTVYVNLNGISLENNITIGNDDIADHYQYTNWNDNTAPEGYPYNTGRTNTRASDGAVRYLYSTGKSAVTVILTGSVQGKADTGDFSSGFITLKVPDAANVVFDNVTFGAGQMAVNVWTESFQSAVANHRITSVTFNNCTFNGNWIQNGQVGADEMIIKACTFNVHENTAYKNNSNPIWIQNLGQCNVTIEDSTFNAVRPIKLWEQNANGTVTIKNNTFNMSNFDDAEGEDAYKNVAIMFCGTTEQVKLGNVEISGNTVTGDATGFICFYNNSTQYPSMNDGATFKLHDNTLNGAKESVLWKTNTEWKPAYVTE